jgi:hypothetical protein
MAAEALLAGTQTYEQHFFSFPVLPDRLGEPREEPQFAGYVDRSVGTLDRRQFTQVYGDRLVQVSTMPSQEKTDVVQDVLAWIDKTMGTKLSGPVYGSMHLDFFDRRTGKPLCDLASAELDVGKMGGFINGRLAGISPDGRRVASVYPFQHLIVGPHPQHGLIMWNADPLPRWPWATGAALLILLLAYFVPLRRRPKAAPVVPS